MDPKQFAGTFKKVKQREQQRDYNRWKLAIYEKINEFDRGIDRQAIIDARQQCDDPNFSVTTWAGEQGGIFAQVRPLQYKANAIGLKDLFKLPGGKLSPLLDEALLGNIMVFNLARQFWAMHTLRVSPRLVHARIHCPRRDADVITQNLKHFLEEYYGS